MTDCKVRMGEIMFNKWFIVKDSADQFIKNGIWYDKVYKKANN